MTNYTSQKNISTTDQLLNSTVKDMLHNVLNRLKESEKRNDLLEERVNLCID